MILPTTGQQRNTYVSHATQTYICQNAIFYLIGTPPLGSSSQDFVNLNLT